MALDTGREDADDGGHSRCSRRNTRLKQPYRRKVACTLIQRPMPSPHRRAYPSQHMLETLTISWLSTGHGRPRVPSVNGAEHLLVCCFSLGDEHVVVEG